MITLGQLNIVIGVLCGLASLIASVYAISVARATLELRRKELHRHKEQEGKEDGNT